MHPTTMGHQIGMISEMEPLNHSPLGGVDDWKRLPPDDLPDSTHLEPSAPPEDQMRGLPPYSEGVEIPPLPTYANSNGQSPDQDFDRQDSAISHASSQFGNGPGTSSGPTSSVCPTCPNCSGACAPPGYEESLQHPTYVMHNEESLQRAGVPH